MVIMRCKGEIGCLQHAYTEDDSKKYRAQLFNNIYNIFRVIIPKNDYYYNWKEYDPNPDPEPNQDL